jgi:uncharacterized membrane protein
MKTPTEIKNHLKHHATSITVFSYAFGVGAVLPAALSRCGANCLACGSCGLALGVVPLVVYFSRKKKPDQGDKIEAGSVSNLNEKSVS